MAPNVPDELAELSEVAGDMVDESETGSGGNGVQDRFHHLFRILQGERDIGYDYPGSTAFRRKFGRIATGVVNVIGDQDLFIVSDVFRFNGHQGNIFYST